MVVGLESLDLEKLEPLRQEALAQGFKFIERLANEYSDGTLRFDQPGEALFAICVGDEIVAIGGLSGFEAFADPGIGRIRRLYVMERFRRAGYGRLLVSAIVEEAKKSYRMLTLRTPNEAASAFYESLGFQTQPAMPETTHHLKL